MAHASGTEKTMFKAKANRQILRASLVLNLTINFVDYPPTNEFFRGPAVAWLDIDETDN